MSRFQFMQALLMKKSLDKYLSQLYLTHPVSLLPCSTALSFRQGTSLTLGEVQVKNGTLSVLPLKHHDGKHLC